MNIPFEIVALASIIGAFIISYFSIPTIVRVARAKGLYDFPDSRKAHTRIVPTLGGLAIFASVLITLSLTINVDQIREFKFLVAGLTIMFFVGVKDDILIIDPWKKLIGQLTASAIIVFLTDLRFTSLHGFLGVHHIPYWFSILLTIFVIIVILNGFNLIDGIDGLASSVGIIAALVFGIWFYLAGIFQYSIISFTLAGGLIAFLRFNVYNGEYKIFMGDTGSLIVGFLVAILTIKFNQANIFYSGIYKIESAPAVAFGILIIPLFDTMRVFLIRIFNGRSPFSADKNHIHHYLLDIGYNHLQSTIRISITNILFIAAVFYLHKQGIELLMAEMLIVALVFSLSLKYLKKSMLDKHNRLDPNPELRFKLKQSPATEVQLPVKKTTRKVKEPAAVSP
jgi:UDP-N-acetylmuramyl pentapeptide phosphotransferase/UDP-N-acetylglucosamine-1-phosphate transferase